MRKNIIRLSLALAFLVGVVACAPKPRVITGTIAKAKLSHVGNRLEIVLNLEGSPETFLVLLNDSHKFGMTTIKNISSKPELIKFVQDIEQTKGWQVKLTCEKMKTQKGPEYLVKTFEKLAGK
jgi:hypothetical protein